MLMQLAKFTLGLLALVLLASSVPAVEARKRKLKFCKINNLLECFNEPIAQFTSQHNGTGIVNNEEEYEQYCFNNHDYLPYCVMQWFKRCGTPIQVELTDRLFVKPMQASMKTFCDSNGTIRPKFLEHSSCLIWQVKMAADYRSECVREMQANNEYIHDRQMQNPNLTSFIGGFCCAYNRWERCIMRHLREKCGEESANTIPYLIHHTTMNLLKDLCPQDRYNPEVPTGVCRPEIFEASKNYVPKGYGSNSVISHYFSYLCPNVGWGLNNVDF